MAQSDFGTIVASTKSGPTLAGDLNTWRDALYSQHKGSAAPTYKQAGMIWLDDTATPWYLKIYDGADWITIGSVNATGNVFGTRFAKGANVASNTALALGLDGNSFDITGTTAITSINSVAIGTIAFLHFTGTPLLTHHATNLILPGAANIQSAAGDEAIFFEYGAGTWRCISYQQATWSPIQLATQVNANTGTTVDFTGIPPWARRITCMFDGISTNGTSLPILQLGDSGGIENTGYLGGSGAISAAPSATTQANGFLLNSALAASVRYGTIVLDLMDAATFKWAAHGVLYDTFGLGVAVAGIKATSAALDRVRLTTVNGTDVFDGSGKMNISWE